MYIGFQLNGSECHSHYLWLCLRMPRRHGTTIDIRLWDCSKFTFLCFELHLKERQERLAWLNSTWLRITFCNKSFSWKQWKDK